MDSLVGSETIEDMGRVIDDLLTDRSILISGHDDEDFAYTVHDDFASPLTLVIAESNATGVALDDYRSIIQQDFQNVIGTTRQPDESAQYQAIRTWVAQHVCGARSMWLADIVFATMLEAQNAGFVPTNTVNMICHLVQSVHVTSESHETRSEHKEETKQNAILRMVCDGRNVGDTLMQKTWVEDFICTATDDVSSDQRAFLNLYQEFQTFPLSKALTQKARGIINSLLRQGTDKISRRDLNATEKRQLNVKNGCCITIGAVAHFDSDASDDENSPESTSAPAFKKQKRKSGKKSGNKNESQVVSLETEAKWITDDAQYSENRLIEVLHPIGESFQWFLAKISSCRKRGDGVQLLLSWETSAVQAYGKKTKFQWKKANGKKTYFASGLYVDNPFVFEEHVNGQPVVKFAAGLLPVKYEPSYGSGRYRLMAGGSAN